MSLEGAVEAVAPIPEVVSEIRAAGGGSFSYCYTCGTCDVVCPWNRVRTFSPRKIVRQAAFGLPDIESEEIWRCTTCGTCAAKCPRGVDPAQVGVAVRRLATAYDSFPPAAKGVRSAAQSLAADGNPLGMEREKRDHWAAGLDVKPFSEGMEILWFVGCYGSYDPRMRRAAVATAKLLKKAGVDFGILGAKENCCGDSIRRSGNEAAFKALARENIKTFVDHGVQRVLVSSPHCLNALRNDYREFRVQFDVVHVAEYLKELMEGGRLPLTRALPARVTWHDPCYLGRRNGVYEPPRDVLKAIPGLTLVEMAEHHEASLCCGGGGGRIWMDTPKGERFSDLRMAQAKDVGADVLATSCPYCISMFEESRLGLDPAGIPEVMDLAEVVLASLAGGTEAP